MWSRFYVYFTRGAVDFIFFFALPQYSLFALLPGLVDTNLYCRKAGWAEYGECAKSSVSPDSRSIELLNVLSDELSWMDMHFELWDNKYLSVLERIALEHDKYMSLSKLLPAFLL